MKPQLTKNTRTTENLALIRIYPVVQGVPRLLAQDAILRGYRVPANVLVCIMRELI